MEGCPCWRAGMCRHGQTPALRPLLSRVRLRLTRNRRSLIQNPTLSQTRRPTMMTMTTTRTVMMTMTTTMTTMTGGMARITTSATGSMTMTDEDYIAELRSHGMLSTNKAADRIEQLTAQLESTLKDRALIIAERDRLREALDEIAEQDGNHAVDRCDCTPAEMLAEARAIARAALKGDSHE